jgi:hypothetical protein
MQPRHFVHEHAARIVIEAVGDQQHGGAAAQRRLNCASVSPMRVPPDQSATCVESCAKATSGSRSRNARVACVRRVPNRNTCSRSRDCSSAWQKYSTARE